MDSSLAGKNLGRVNAGKAFFLVGLSVWIFCRILLTSRYGYDGGSIAALLSWGLYVGLFLCIFSELFNTVIHIKKLFLIAILIVFVLLLWGLGGNDIASMLVIAFTARKFRFRDILFTATLCTVIAVLFVIGSFALGVIGQTYDYDRGRGSLGFGWTTFLSHYYLLLAVAYSVLRGTRIRLIELGIMALIDFAIFELTGARNSFVLALAFLIIVEVIRKTGHWRFGKTASVVVAAAFPVCALVSAALYLTVSPYSPFGSMLNELLSYRLIYTQRAFSMYDVSLFGDVVKWVTQSSIASGASTASQYLYVDCSYLNGLLNYGWAFFLAMLAALSVVSFRATQSGGAIVGIGLVIFAVHGVVDPQLLDLHYCTFLLLLGGVFDSQASWREKMSYLLDSPHANKLTGIRNASTPTGCKRSRLLKAGNNGGDCV